MSSIFGQTLLLSVDGVLGVGLPCRMWQVKAQPLLGWHRRRLRRPGDDVRLFRLGGIIRRWRLSKGPSLFFPSFSLLFWIVLWVFLKKKKIVLWVVVARVDVPIRPGRVRGGSGRGPNPTGLSVGCGGSSRCPNPTGRRVVVARDDVPIRPSGV